MRAADDDSAAVRAPGRERPYATIITKLSTKAACRSLKIADIIGQTSPNPIASIAMAGGQTGAERRVVEPGHGDLPDGVDDRPNVMTGQRPQQAAACDAGHRLCRSPACRPRRSLAGTGDGPPPLPGAQRFALELPAREHARRDASGMRSKPNDSTCVILPSLICLQLLWCACTARGCGHTTHRHRFSAALTRIEPRKYHAFETFTANENNVSRRASGRFPRRPCGADDASVSAPALRPARGKRPGPAERPAVRRCRRASARRAGNR